MQSAELKSIYLNLAWMLEGLKSSRRETSLIARHFERCILVRHKYYSREQAILEGYLTLR